MEFGWSRQQENLRQEARSVAASAVEQYGWQSDSWITGFSKEFARELADRRWIGMSWPEEFGGAGRSKIDRLIIAEELIGAGAPLGAMWFADRQIGPTLIAYGSSGQQASLLPGILSGDDTWCIGMSEPDAGSDLVALSTSAVREGAHWRISGKKIWTSFADVADFCYLICRTSAEGPPHSGISEIVVPMDSPGIEVRPIRDMAGHSHFCEMFFDGVRVPAENLVGAEGGAFRQTMRQLEHERGGIDRLVSNYGLYRRALDVVDIADATIRQEIAALESTYHVGRLLVYREAMGQVPPGFSAATKIACTEHEVRVAAFVARAFGAETMLSSEISSGVCYAPAYTIMGGTSNVLRNVVAERILGLPKEPR